MQTLNLRNSPGGILEKFLVIIFLLKEISIRRLNQERPHRFIAQHNEKNADGQSKFPSKSKVSRQNFLSDEKTKGKNAEDKSHEAREDDGSPNDELNVPQPVMENRKGNEGGITGDEKIKNRRHGNVVPEEKVRASPRVTDESPNGDKEVLFARQFGCFSQCSLKQENMSINHHHNEIDLIRMIENTGHRPPSKPVAGFHALNEKRSEIQNEVNGTQEVTRTEQNPMSMFLPQIKKGKVKKRGGNHDGPRHQRPSPKEGVPILVREKPHEVTQRPD